MQRIAVFGARTDEPSLTLPTCVRQHADTQSRGLRTSKCQHRGVSQTFGLNRLTSRALLVAIRVGHEAMTQACQGMTRAGRRCSLTSASKLKDEKGRFVAEPLSRGAVHCLFHACPFCCTPAAPTGPLVMLFVDLETTGTDVSRDRIVEFAALQVHELQEVPGPSYATVVSVESEILTARGADAAKVHKIDDAEIALGPSFPEVWSRFLEFVEYLLNTTVHEDSDSSSDSADGSPRLARPPDETPLLLLAAHNGHRFDFAMLLFECHRHKLSTTPFERWYFVDTIAVVRAAQEEVGHCAKLQCLVRGLGAPQSARAHRALDDCHALQSIAAYLAMRLGCSLSMLLRKFAAKFDASESIAQVITMCEARHF